MSARSDAQEAQAGELRVALLSAVALLSGIGAVAVYSTTAALELDRTLPPHFLRHAVGILGGVLAAAIAARMPLAFWHRIALPAWIATVALLVLTVAFGRTAGGAQRWLVVPGIGFSFQPAELAKLATVLAAAALLARPDARMEVTPRRMGMVFALAAVPAFLCLLQPDLGNAAILVGLVGILLFAAGAKLRWLLGPAALGGVVIGIYSWVNPYALRRWTGFLDPWERATTEGFQLVQSFIAFGRGGWWGVRLGDGRQKLSYLPEAHTDFILSAVAEELGLIGVLVVLGGFFALWIAGLRISLRQKHRFGMLLGFAMTALLAVPATLNAAVVMGLLPTKGLTLPFVSYGRTSLMMSCLAVGILLGLTRSATHEGARR